MAKEDALVDALTETIVYPEHGKLKALDGKNRTIGQFIEWLGEKGMVICRETYNADNEDLVPINMSIQQLLAKYFDIDVHKLDDEKQAMLDLIREQNRRKDHESNSG